MFPFLKSDHAKLRENAKNWLYMANKVYNFRKDRMAESDISALRQLIEEVKVGRKAGTSGSERLRSSVAALKALLEQVGGSYYPRTALTENVEFFFAAIIIYVGFTAFFVKPFKIPTNSMWPTYHGMTAEVYENAEDGPGAIAKAARFVAFGATHYDVVAPADGELLVPVFENGAYFYESATVRRYFVIPAAGRQWSLRIGDATARFKVPEDFSPPKEVYSRLLGGDGDDRAYLKTLYGKARRGQSLRERVDYRMPDGRIRQISVIWVRTGKMYKKGDSILSFDLMTGDQLFVDRMAYHFVSPKVGDGFVFKTGGIAKLAHSPEKFYIKHLAGTPGDVVRIEGGGLLVNGEPAEGSVAFGFNAAKQGKYRGYTFDPVYAVEIDLEVDQTVPEGWFLALGDNSHNSYDSRGFGYVPQGSVVGRPIAIYYPFTKRFGLAK